jgi:hypothetical protein
MHLEKYYLYYKELHSWRSRKDGGGNLKNANKSPIHQKTPISQLNYSFKKIILIQWKKLKQYYF